MEREIWNIARNACMKTKPKPLMSRGSVTILSGRVLGFDVNIDLRHGYGDR